MGPGCVEANACAGLASSRNAAMVNLITYDRLPSIESQGDIATPAGDLA
jgi:hypothetical protein